MREKSQEFKKGGRLCDVKIERRVVVVASAEFPTLYRDSGCAPAAGGAGRS